MANDLHLDQDLIDQLVNEAAEGGAEALDAHTEPEPAPKPAGPKKPIEIPKNIDRILKMKVPVIIKIAEKTMTIENVLKLNLGSVLQFDKDAYQLIDLMVNNRTIGLGQPVKIGENFGLKITQIGDIKDTIKSLGGQD